MGLTRLKFGKQHNCDNTRSMTISGVTVTGVNCTSEGTCLCWSATRPRYIMFTRLISSPASGSDTQPKTAQESRSISSSSIFHEIRFIKII